MTWGEAVSLTSTLCQDPTSWVAASVGQWDHPRSWEWFLLADMYDLTHQIAWRSAGSKGGRPKPYPRPGATVRRTKASVSQEVVLAALREAGHTNLPTAA